MKKFILLIVIVTINFEINAQDNKITQTGNVGIGTTNPQEILHILKKNLPNDGQVHDVLMIQANTDGDRQSGFGARINFCINKYGNIAVGTSSSLGAISVYDSNNENSFGTMAFATKERYDKELTNKMWLDRLGNLGIGIKDTEGYKLAVAGKVVAEEVKIAIQANWPDFVLKKDYNLPTIKEVEKQIKEKGHLKDIPSAKEVDKNGICLGEMNAKLLQKIEELTLYTIAQEKEISKLKSLAEKFIELQSRLENLESKN